MTDVSDETLRLAEESLVVSKRPVVTGKVRVQTQTELVEEVASLNLDSDEVEVERVAIDREIDHVPDVRTEGDVTIVPVVEEIVVVEKRLVLKEEIRITRRRASETVEVPVTLRKQRAVIERLDNTATTPIEEEEPQ